MKLQIALLSLTIPFANAGCLKDRDFDGFETKKGCSFDKVKRQVIIARRKLVRAGVSCLRVEQELLDLMGETDINAVERRIDTLCRDAVADSANNADYTVSFEGIPTAATDDDSETLNRWLKEYYDGGTEWNEFIQQRAPGAYNLNGATRGVKSFYHNTAKKRIVTWPSTSISNFDTCQNNSAMCCWVQDRQADNDGNCAQQYPIAKGARLWTPDNCIDKDPADNTDICYVDMKRSPESNHVADGGAVYSDEEEGTYEGDAHCHGFAWADEATSTSNRFKGNNLFYVSMYDHLRVRGYVREVPGAPMCGCVEQMPTVSRADCTQMEVTEDFDFEYNGQNDFRVKVTNARVEFQACEGLDDNNNDLEAYYARLLQEGAITEGTGEVKFSDVIVGDGQCEGAIDEFVADKFNIRRA